MPPLIDASVRGLIECGVAVVVGTRDAQLRPEITRAWGPRLLDDGRTLEVCLGMPSSRRTLANIGENGQVAVTCVRPTDYRQVQLKGRSVETLATTDEDRARVARHRDAFVREVAEVGLRGDRVPAFWDHDDEAAMVKIRLAVAEAYEQTPGPDAGRPL